MRLLVAAVVLIGIASPVLAAEPGLSVDPVRVGPGEGLRFDLVFPEDAEGMAQLHVGDGRVEQINSAVGELTVSADAPAEPGAYTARLVVQRSGGEATYEVSYDVVGEERGVPAPSAAWLVGAVVLAGSLRRRGVSGPATGRTRDASST